jgi:Secretion system C-terminal sorting domain
LETIGNNWKQLETKILLTIVFSFSLFVDCKSQLIIPTTIPGAWTRTPSQGATGVCYANPRSFADINGLIFNSNPIASTSPNPNSAGFTKFSDRSGPSSTVPNNVTTYYRTFIPFTSTAQFPSLCLVTYALSVDNAFRIYVNGNSASTNILNNGFILSDQTCGNQSTNYSGNNWQITTYGDITQDFINSQSPASLVVEAINGVNTSAHTSWFAGSITAWRHTDLNPDFIMSPSFNMATGLLTLGISLSAVSNGPTHGWLVEKSTNGINWTTEMIYPTPNVPSTRGGAQLSGFTRLIQFSPCTPSAKAFVRVTHTVSAGTCAKSYQQSWSNVCPTLNNSGNEDLIKYPYQDISVVPEILTTDRIAEIEQSTYEKLNVEDRSYYFGDDFISTQDTLLEAKISKMLISPNPSKDGYIRINSSNSNIETIKLVSMLGKVVYSNKYNPEEVIDVSEINSGLYFVQALDVNGEIIEVEKLLLNLR